jgi:hypothetical protein
MWEARTDRVSTEPPPKAKPIDLSVLNRLNSTAVAYWSAMLVWVGVLAVWWIERGPDHPFVALLATTWAFALTPGVAVPIFRRLPPGWCRVPQGERILHLMLGVPIFGWLLEHSGWNRRNAFITWRPLTRTRLSDREQAVRGGGGAHGACFVVHATLAALALFTGHPSGALWILAPGIIFHFYPVLLQRSIMLRLQPLLNRRGSSVALPSTSSSG